MNSIRPELAKERRASRSAAPRCPGLFRPTPAQDGWLARVRVPAGIVHSAQMRLLTTLSESVGDAHIDITNRANVQLRSLAAPLSAEHLAQMQALGLAAHPRVDPLRNVMASPTAGIDPAQVMDMRPLAAEIDAFLSTHLELANLSPKFSIGLAGGEHVSIRSLPNDVRFSAVRLDSSLGRRAPLDPLGDVALWLQLAGVDDLLGWWIAPQDCVAVVGAIAHLYLEYLDHLDNLVDPAARRPRLKTVLLALGHERVNECLRPFSTHLPVPPPPSLSDHSPPSRLLGFQNQYQPTLTYIGLALPLGRLTAAQGRGLADLADAVGSSTLRLTPWRGLLLPDVPQEQVARVQALLTALQLDSQTDSVWGGLIACSGTTGCAASFTDTQRDARAIAQAFQNQSGLDHPFIIHVSGCAKSCAHHNASDVTLIGTPNGYELYVAPKLASRQATESTAGAGGRATWGKRVQTMLSPDDAPQRAVQWAQQSRDSPRYTSAVSRPSAGGR
jgi:ferredoxin-nitrite reductase